MNAKIKIHQIFYDEASRNKLSDVFLPLDNTSNPRPDWYEFWVIRNFLLNNTLEENTWYGFLSPNFSLKTQIQPQSVIDVLRQVPIEQEVMLFSYPWDYICFFQNVWEQGECFHPGITELADSFYKSIGMDLNLPGMVGHLGNTIFSNYFAAKKKFWSDWLLMADQFFHYAEQFDALKVETQHRLNPAPMKVFIQERMASVLLSLNPYQVGYIDPVEHAPIQFQFHQNEPVSLRRKLAYCHQAKYEFLRTQDVRHMNNFYQARSEIVWA